MVLHGYIVTDSDTSSSVRVPGALAANLLSKSASYSFATFPRAHMFLRAGGLLGAAVRDYRHLPPA